MSNAQVEFYIQGLDLNEQLCRSLVDVLPKLVLADCLAAVEQVEQGRHPAVHDGVHLIDFVIGINLRNLGV